MLRPRYTLSVLTLIASLAANQALAQSNGNFRSAASGDWGNAATWERYTGGTWVAAAVSPDAANGTITIRAGHTVSLPPVDLDLDQVVVNAGGTLNTNAFADLNVIDGPGTDLLVNGTLALSGQYLFGPGSIVVASGGLFTCVTGYIGAGTVLDIQSGASAITNGNAFVDGTVNNAGIWTMQSGYLATTGFGEHIFNNLSGGVLELNGWNDPNQSVSFLTVNNAGTIEQNNSTVQCTWYSVPLNNTGTLNVNGGVFRHNNGTITNTGTFAFDAGSSLKLAAGDFINGPGGSILDLPHLINEYGDLELSAGSSCDPIPLLTQTNGTMTVAQPLTVVQYDLLGGGFTGPAEVTIPAGGQFNLTTGYINAGGLLHILTGATATTNGNAYIDGTVNNAGTWNMQSGWIGTTGFGDHVFNNLSGGILNLNSWTDNSISWSFANLNNAGTVNKNNGSVQFGFWSTPFMNQAGGVFNALDGATFFSNGIFGPCGGTFNIEPSATLGANIDLPFTGATIVNNGTITAPNIVFVGAASQTLSGTGSIRNLTMNCTCVLDLGSAHTVDSVLTLTSGRIDVGPYDLILPRAAANSLLGGNAASYVLTNGSGGLKRAMTSAAHTFAVGTANTYLPVTVEYLTGPAENFTARVIDGVSTDYNDPGEATGNPVTQHNLLNTWVITEETPGGNNAQLTFQWNAANEGTSFDRNACAALAYDGLSWVVVDPFAPAQGSGPYTQTGLSFDGFREFTVGDAASLTLTVGIDETSSTSSVSAFPNPMTDQLTVTSSGGPFRSFELHDALGRLVRGGTINANTFLLQRDGLIAGAYVLTTRTVDASARVRIVIE